ncbi:methyltransferase domain-containing protein [Nonomuraea sp. NPDC055795]
MTVTGAYGPSDLTAYLTSSGVLDPDDARQRVWLRAFDEVPRHLFVPAYAWAQPQYDTPDHVISRDHDPTNWWKAVYTNTAIITQRGEGTTDVADVSAYPTSSVSSPHVVAEMLHLLDLERHHNVLEIGTGSGWTAGLLSWRLGDDQVTTIEVDKTVAAAAEENLRRTGGVVEVVVGDGQLGWPDHAPYDRVHVTCGVREVPYSWVEQTRPGGSIVLPWMPMPGQWGMQLRLDVLDDGSAVGTFHNDCGFMMLRAQREAWPTVPDDSADSVTTTTRTDPREAWAALNRGFGLGLAATAPHIAITSAGREALADGSGWVMRLRDLRDDGWAIATVRPGEDTEVVQSGARQLWTQLETAFMEWLRGGRPDRSAYRMLVTPARQDVWLS